MGIFAFLRCLVFGALAGMAASFAASEARSGGWRWLTAAFDLALALLFLMALILEGRAAWGI